MLIHCCILLDFLCELCYDARIHEHQIIINNLILQPLGKFAVCMEIYSLYEPVLKFCRKPGEYRPHTFTFCFNP